MQHPVHAVADAGEAGSRLHVDVRGAILDRLLDHRVDDADDRRRLRVDPASLRAVFGLGRGGVRVVAPDLGHGLLADSVPGVGGTNGDRGGRPGGSGGRRRLRVGWVILVDRFLDVAGGCQRGHHLHAGDELDVIEGNHVGRVTHRHEEALPQPLHRDQVVALGLLFLDQAHGILVDLKLRQVHEVDPHGRGFRLGDHLLGSEALVDDHTADASLLPGVGPDVVRLAVLLGGNDLLLDKDLACVLLSHSHS